MYFEKEEAKLSLLANNMILYVDYPKEFTQNLLEPITKFKKVARHKVNSYYLSVY